jgi:hypothetical protein
MRSPFRAASLLALAVIALSCTDAPTAPDTTQHGAFRAARLRMSPSFSPVAARAYATLADLGVQLTMVRVRLVNDAGTVVKDTTIAFPIDQDSLSVSLPVQIQGAEQSFDATIELRDASGAVFFSRTQRVTARDASLPAAPSPIIDLVFVGPGAAARTMTISPAVATVTPGTLPELVASALDADGRAVTDLLIAKWTSSDTTIATVTGTTGTAATVRGTGRRGVATFTATTIGGVAGTALLTFLPQPAQLAIVGGIAQTGPAGHDLAQPFVVQLLGVDGLGIAKQTLAFRGVTAGSVVATASTTTDAEGKASTVLTPGRTPGKFVFEATAGTLSATLEVTAVAGAPSQLVVTQSLPTSLSVGVAPILPVLGHLADDMGNAVQQAGITITAAASVAPGGQSFSASANTDARGEVSIALPAYLGTIGTATITLSSPLLGTISTTTIPVSAGAAAALQLLQQAPATAASGALLNPAPALQLVDAGGNAVAAAIPVTVALGDGQVGTLGGTTTVTTGTDGRATFTGLAISGTVGSYSLKFTAGSLAPLTSTAIALMAGAAAKLAWLTEPPDAIDVGAPITPTPRARLVDAQGNPVRTANVKLRERGSGGNGIFLDSTITDANGEANLPISEYRGPVGTLRFAVTSEGLDSLVKAIVARAGAPAALMLAQAPAATAINGVALTPAPVVQLVDAGGNPVTGALTVTATLEGITGTLGGTTSVAIGADGRATFGALTITAPTGPYVLRFTAGTLTPATTTPITVEPGAAAQIVAASALGQIAPVATVIPVAPAARVLDAAGNGVPGVLVQFTPSAGSTVNGGATPDTVTTDATGLASARSWTMGTTASSYTLDVASDGLSGSPIRFVSDAVAGAATRFIVTSSSLLPVAGQTVTIRAVLADLHGNTVPAAGHTVSWSAAPSGGSFASATSVTDSSGAATVIYTVPTVAGTVAIVSATEGTLTGSVGGITVGAGSAATLGLIGGWPGTGGTAADALFATPPVLQLQDGSGNAVATPPRATAGDIER